MSTWPENKYDQYHAHVYFDEASEGAARQLCIAAWQNHHVSLGRFHRRPVGPHPCWSCQLAFDGDQFENIMPWLEAHRGELTILIHPIMGDVYAEHTQLAGWMGQACDLNLQVFSS